MTDVTLQNPIVTAVQAIKSGDDVAAVSNTTPLFTYDITNIKGSQQLAALKGRSYKVWCTAPATAAKYSAVQIWNPANSGYIVYVAAISGFNSTGTQQWYPLMNATKLTTDTGTINPQDSLNVATPPFLLCVDALTARTSNPSFGVPVSSIAAQGGGLQMGSEIFMIREGSGLRYEGGNVNVGMNLVAVVMLIPVADANT